MNRRDQPETAESDPALLRQKLLALTGVAVVLLFVPAGAEIIDMIRMSEVTDGIITRATAVISDDLGITTSRPIITYRYEVNEAEYASSRYLPGFAGNLITWTGGLRSVPSYEAGSPVEIHFAPSNPGHSCLRYGLFKWSLAFPIALIGGIAASQKTGLRRAWNALALAMLWGGILCIFTAPDAIAVSSLPVYLLGFAVLYALAYAFDLVRASLNTPRTYGDRT